MAPDRGVNLSSSSASSSTLHQNHDHNVWHDEENEPSPSSSNDLSSTITAHDGETSRTAKLASDLGLYRTPTTHKDSLVDATNFTLRSTVLGLLIGVIICFSNTYFGLQTGWVSGMAMPASLIGFAFFKTPFIAKHLKLPFTPVENVLVQTVAGAVGTMPLGLGFVGVIPSLEFLLKKGEGGPVDLSLWRLIVWGLGLCLFGVVFAVPLRKQVIIRERLKFPSGTATALMISVLHGGAEEKNEIVTEGTEEREQLLSGSGENGEGEGDSEEDKRTDWKKQIKLLLWAFSGSGAYTLIQYFVPFLHRLPIFGTYLADTWVWTLNPSPAYVGQGIIMGPATTFHMLLGAVMGWAVLSPLAKREGWAPGPVNDWETGSKGWIVWVSLAIMLADAIVNLGWLVLRPVVTYGPAFVSEKWHEMQKSESASKFLLGHVVPTPGHYHKVNGAGTQKPNHKTDEDLPDDAPPHHLVTGKTVGWMLPVTLVLCVVCVHITFGEYIPLSLNILALFLALLLSIMGVRALGETDLNPVSGISKLTQLLFALVQPTGKHAHHAIIINLLAGAVSESGALQAGDILQDLKAGHLIGASPKAQFYGQLIGSVVGAVVSAAVYKLYVSVYSVPGELFQVPTAYVWIFTARLVTGRGLPTMAWQYALGAGGIFTLTTILRIYLAAGQEGSTRKRLHPWVPGGIAVAVGMYNTPSFTLARTVGGIITLWYVNHKKNAETGVIVLASGLILGEGVMSIVNLVLASFGVPHL